MKTSCALALLLAAYAPAAEKWADPGLTTTRGLVLWLDAARLPDAWQARGKPALPPNAPVDVAYDASGSGHHLGQRAREAQPRLARVGGRPVLRFDGKDDFLSATNLVRDLDRFTLVVHAAPRSNAGFFRAFVSANETGKNDYTTGFNLDLGGVPTATFSCVNAEGKGFGGAANLLPAARPFRVFHTLTLTSEPGKEGVKLFVGGSPAGKRDRDEGVVRADDITVGARYYSNTGDAPCASGFLDGDIAEVLLFDRLLTADELKSVHDYLRKKHAALDAAEEDNLVVLKTVDKPPPVQVFVPGFAVKQLPLDLPNINNVRYRHDGKLVALAYDGNVYLLADTDGDGVEDRATLFWDNRGALRGPIGMAVTPKGYRHGDGVFVASKGKLSLIVDSKGTGKADKEIVVAKGWKELPHGVDALGVALDADGNVYFGLGCADYTNAYQIDKDGKAHYDLKSERGTILKVSPDFKKREVVATGIRFPVGMAFNRLGDLFATDQEGATWLPNGNPFDELLHVRKGRHYGFPPRHPKHLPDVIDEPSVFDYGPQHQSTCGLAFNLPVNGGPVFGPGSWRGDALVTGYSRGKLYRTRLDDCQSTYVARTQLLASLNMLAVDCCISPRGELVVAAHGGLPDWGTGPGGKGGLYKLAPDRKPPPRPVLAWAAGPRETRIAFDRPLDPEHLRELTSRVRIEYGEHVRAGDRFEVHRPGYAVVQNQLAEPRYRLPVLGTAVSPDRRTLILTTAEQKRPLHHAITLPGFGRPEKPGKGELPQHPVIDLDHDLCGVEADWYPKGGQKLSTWLPHLDLSVSRKLTAGSAEHDDFWKTVEGKEGRLVLTTSLDLDNLLRSAYQPGSKPDHEVKPEEVHLLFHGYHPFNVWVTGHGPKDSASFGGKQPHVAPVDLRPKPGKPVSVRLEVNNQKGDTPDVGISFRTEEGIKRDGEWKTGPFYAWKMPLRRFVPQWTEAKPPAAVARKVPELEGGSWARGRKVFLSDEAACSRCHRVGGSGGQIGPDLSNLIHRDYASVLRDIVDPGAALNPDHLAQVVELKSGRVLTGVPRSAGPGKIILGDASGQEVTLTHDEIESMTPAPGSLMPQGIDRVLGPDKMRDLLTYLLTEPLRPAPVEAAGAPPPRSRAEVAAVFKHVEKSDRPAKRLRVVLAAGPKDHGPGEHDYPLWQRRWVNLLSLADNVHVETSEGWPSDRQFERADVIAFYSNNPGWSAEKGPQLDAFLKRGGGLVYLHYAVDGHKDADALAKRIGLAWRGGASLFRHGALELSFPDAKHPITRGFEKVKFTDESYWNLVGDVKDVHVLATGKEGGESRPLLWTREHGRGRIFVSIPGHYNWTFDDPLFRLLVLRGICWTAGEPPNRLSELAMPGARVAE